MTPIDREREMRQAYMFCAVGKRYGARVARELQRRHGKSGDAIERAYAAALGVAGIQDVRRYVDRDRVTVLGCAPGHRATKLIRPSGIAGYAAGRWFATTEVTVAGIGELAGLLGQLEREPRLFLIRGRLIQGRHPGRVRRLLHPDPKASDQPYFEACAQRWAGLDFDALELPDGVDPVDLEAVAAIAVARLAEPFRRASCWAQLTSGAGIKPGGRIRLFYWLDRPASGAELKRWLGDVPGLDTSTLNDVTPNYVARPIFDGVADPVPVRSRLIPGELDEVAVPDLPAPPPRPVRPAAVGTAPAWRAAAARWAAPSATPPPACATSRARPRAGAIRPV